ncbi:MAG TPA: MinD/ParA family protein [Deltaproteobacteria bacterium]|nr:MinD/ParA family protein [Deltaproteobacteria bacterium]
MRHILAVGGGKGGSGKSFISGNMGILLAARGKRTLLIDVDLGGANLHTMIGISYPRVSLSDFISKDVESLDDIVIPTAVPNLFLISGAQNSLDIANLHYQQKMRLLKAIPKLSFEYIILDLGAGTSFNTIDFFMVSNYCLFVTTPEPTSIENVYRLIRAIYLRKIKYVLNEDDFKAFLDGFLDRHKGIKLDFLADLLSMLHRKDPEKAMIMKQTLQSLNFKLIVNQHRKQDRPDLGQLMATLARKHLALKMDFWGNVSFDDRVHTAICSKVPFIQKYPYTRTATDLREICDSIMLLAEQTEEFQYAQQELQFE